jgi:hypothetical protein
MSSTGNDRDRRDDERGDRRRGDRRSAASDVDPANVAVERRVRERRRIARRLVDVFRSFLGLPPAG